jgi:hypothetical protein
MKEKSALRWVVKAVVIPESLVFGDTGDAERLAREPRY